MSASAGNVAWTAFAGATGVGDTIGAFASLGAAVATAGGQFVVVQSTTAGWTGLAVPASGDDLVITIARAGADGTDTLAADVDARWAARLVSARFGSPETSCKSEKTGLPVGVAVCPAPAWEMIELNNPSDVPLIEAELVRRAQTEPI